MGTYVPPPPPQKQGGGGGGGLIGWSFLTALATILFGLSLAANVVLLLLVLILGAVAGGGADAAGGVLTRTVVEGGDDKIAVVPVEGIIEPIMAGQVIAAIEKAAEDDAVVAVVLSIDSPGGGVTPSDEIHHAVERLKADTGKPVVALLNSLAASGGYYAACGAQEIIAQPTTLTGSIGVLLSRWDLTGFGEKYGIADGSIVSTGSDFKTAGDFFTELEPDQRAYLVAVIDDSFDSFKRVVLAARKSEMDANEVTIDEVANGKIFSTRQALALGLIDAQGYAKDAHAAAARLAGVTNPTVIRYDRPPTALEALGVDGGAAGTPAAGLALDAATLDALMTPRLQYLWKGR